jgi:hypothetical protein
MGAWGTGTFDNDDASDWLQQFESDGPAAAEAALAQVLDQEPDDYIDATDAAYALAAAELIAAARDGDTGRLPAEAKAALKEHADDLAEAGYERKALQAVNRIMKKSEIKDLWEESDDAEAFTEQVQELMERLRG